MSSTSSSWPTPTLPAQGSCRCGAIRFEITALPVVTLACHCSGCKRMTSSAFTLNAAVPPSGFKLLTGSPVPGGIKAENAEVRHCCPDCHSLVYSTSVRFPHTFVCATLLDDPSWFRPYMEMQTAQKLGTVETGAVRSFKVFPPGEEWGRAMEEYGRLIGGTE